MAWREGGRLGRRLIGLALVLLVLLFGVAATSLVNGMIGREHHKLAEQAMTQVVREAAGAVVQDLTAYENTIEVVAAAVGTSYPNLTARTFAGITEPLTADRLPGATGVAFVAPVKDAEVGTAEAYWRAHGAAGLVLRRTGATTGHQFMIFTRSFGSASSAPGRDLSTTPATADALSVSRRTWTFSVSAAHTAPEDARSPADGGQPTVIMTAAVLDRVGAFRGWAVLSVHAGDFLRAALTRRTGNVANMQVDDIDAGSSRTIVSVAAGRAIADAGLRRSQQMYVGQRLWRLELLPTTVLLSDADSRLSRLTPYLGGSFTLLLAVLIAVLWSGRNRAMDRVDRATTALRRDIERREAVEQQLRERERELHELAFHDQLTGLVNRGLFYDRVADAVHTPEPDGRPFAVVFIDLDGFKQVNDQYGHGAGDLVLQVTAARLRSCTRDTDTVARFGGDEFAVLLREFDRLEDVHNIAERMIDLLSRPIVAGSHTAAVTASIGIAMSRPGYDADALLRCADLAMYQAKTTGKSRHVLATS